MGFGADLGMTAAQSGLNIIGSVIGNAMAAKREAQARKENFEYGEQAAQNADARQRAQYKDLYSAGAQLNQLKEAGLSPEIMYSGGGMSLGGSATGAMGNSGAVSPTTFGVEPVQLAQIRNINADTKVKEEQARNISTQTAHENVLKEWDEMTKNNDYLQYTLAQSYVINDDGTETDLYSMAGNYEDAEEFIKAVHKLPKVNADQDLAWKTELGGHKLREIYETRKLFNKNLKALETEELNAKFQYQIINAMKNNDFAEMNAKSAVGALKAAVQTNELTEQQKSAWNELLEEFEKWGKWGHIGKNIAIILGMIIHEGLSNYHLPNIETNYDQRTTNNNRYDVTNHNTYKHRRE